MQKARRSGIKIMGELIGLVRPLILVMLLAILLGTLGYLCAIFITICACGSINSFLCEEGGVAEALNPVSGISVQQFLMIMVVIAILRGILHYAEQYCNHFIAFKLLAIIRHKVFQKLRKLCPAKLEGKDKGNLIALITSDIELLEVFYAHTISPIAIALLTSVVMIWWIGSFHWYSGMLALCAYVTIGVLIPLWNGKRGGNAGMAFRDEFGELNSFVLDSLYGLDETMQYGRGSDRKEQITQKSRHLSILQKELGVREGKQKALTNTLILLFSLGMLILNIFLYQKGEIGTAGLLLGTVAMMSSFGPVTALSNLSNQLNQTLASGQRVLALLEEDPVLEEIEGEAEIQKEVGAKMEEVDFSYTNTQILSHYSLDVRPASITGIHGASGSGKSTVLKLIMRFWDADKGVVSVQGEDVKKIPTGTLRQIERYVTQETILFHNSIAENIRIAKQDATEEEIMEAAKKASIHDFIMSLPDGYDTQVGELGDTLSGGERQRIGVARAFLHSSPLILMDEPTSNLDSLNEGIILKAMKESAKDKTILLVSHRKSTMNVADHVIEM